MLTSSKPPSLMMASLALLLGAVGVTAMPAQQDPPFPAPTRAIELRAEATDAWVSVDKTGLPTTITPVVSGATTLSAIPTELTATVVTRTAYGELTTSTGTAPALPTANNKKGKGAFLVCSNADGDYAPFCEPSADSSLYTGTTYFVTWDASALNSTKVTVTGTYLNSTTGETGDDAFTADELRASWSYYAWTPNKGYLSHGNGSAVRVVLSLKELSADGETATATHAGPTVLVTKAPKYQQAAPELPKGAALYIGLPVIFGFCLLMVCGVCAWNRKTRHIGLGNIMSRGRHGYGIAKSRAKRMTRTMKSGAAGRRLSKRDRAAQQHHMHMMDNVPEDQMYRDEPQRFDGRADYDYDADAREVRMGGGGGGYGHARRDSDGLGSLAGTPTSEHFPRQQGGGNVFREEMERQQRQRK